MIVNLLPAGLVGLMIAALMAALMGAMSSVFNSASTMVTLDFYKKFRPEASEAQLVLIGRVTTGVMVVLGVLWVPFIQSLNNQLWLYLQSVQAYISPPIAVCFIFGILWPRLNGQGAIASLLVGLVMGAARFVLEVLDKTRHYEPRIVGGLVEMNFLHYAIVMFVVCAIVLVGVSFLYPAPARKRLAGLTFATVNEKLDTKAPAAPHLAKESARERAVNIFFTVVLIATVVGLLFHFR
jgi:SSS family solute:Na+ symporter